MSTYSNVRVNVYGPVETLLKIKEREVSGPNPESKFEPRDRLFNTCDFDYYLDEKTPSIRIHDSCWNKVWDDLDVFSDLSSTYPDCEVNVVWDTMDGFNAEGGWTFENGEMSGEWENDQFEETATLDVWFNSKDFIPYNLQVIKSYLRRNDLDPIELEEDPENPLHYTAEVDGMIDWLGDITEPPLVGCRVEAFYSIEGEVLSHEEDDAVEGLGYVETSSS